MKSREGYVVTPGVAVSMAAEHEVLERIHERLQAQN